MHRRLIHWLALALATGCSFTIKSAESDGAGSDAANVDSPPGDTGLVTDGPSVDAVSMVDAAPDASSIVVSCPGSMCGSNCCQGTCASQIASVCMGKTYECDGPEDCSGPAVCCNDKNGSRCTTSSCSSPGFEVCHSTTDCSFTCNDCSFRPDYGQTVCCE